jgi:hypothetical protein
MKCFLKCNFAILLRLNGMHKFSQSDGYGLLMEHSGTDWINTEKSNSGLGEEDRAVYIGGVTRKLAH